MEAPSTSPKEVPTEIYPIPGRLCSGTVTKECDKRVEVNKISGTPIHSGQKGLCEKESNSGSVPIEQVHIVRQVSDAYDITNMDFNSPWSLHHFFRLKG